MKYKTLFRLGLRLIGVYFFITGVCYIPSSATNMWSMLSDQPVMSLQMVRTIGWSLGPALQICAGLYLFFGGKWIVNKAIPSNKRYCHECGYLLEGIKGTRCPECDTEFRLQGAGSDGAVGDPRDV